MKARKKTRDNDQFFGKDMSREQNRSKGKKTSFEDDDFDWESFDEWDNDFPEFKH
ncbi:MAG: hypothetical protein RQ867_07670 [Mariprofundaceae bacterium]|nr:hypothetical protein [Mariprofundaceae bacterium]